MATTDEPSLTELRMEGISKAREDAFRREGVEGIEASPMDEGFPPLLQLISTGSYSFLDNDYFDASNHSNINVADKEDSSNAFTGFNSSYPQGLDEAAASLAYGTTPFDQADAPSEATTVDISKLVAENENMSNESTLKSRGVLTPKSILSRRGAPSTPREAQAELTKKVSFGSRSPNGDAYEAANGDTSQAPQNPMHKFAKKESQRKFFSQPMPTTTKLAGTMKGTASTHSGPVRRCTLHDSDGAKKENYVLFRTKSSKQFSGLQSKQPREENKSSDATSKKDSFQGKALPAGRYFDALKGPELEILKDSEELLLPLDQQWPFLLRFPIGCFGICLGLGSQTMLWKTLATSASVSFLRIPLVINLLLWCLAVAALVGISIVYALKCLLYFEAVRREYYHPVRVNFFFAPWIACMFLTLGIPPRIATSIHPAVWCLFTIPVLMLELKIYGQWLSGGARRLSKVANPSTHLSLVGNFVSALLASVVGWKEPAVFFWAVGCAHYLVLFVTLYQRLPTAEVLTKELHPVFFLFVAAPSAASVAWKSIVGDFDYVSRVAYFVALFLYSSLVVRINFFCGFKFSITWWAYTFPMTASAIATIHYSLEIRHPITQVMAVTLSLISSIIVLSLFISTVLHALTGRLFPNDLAIAITTRRHKRKHNGLKSDSSNSLLLENKMEECGDDPNKLTLPKEGGMLVASIQNGLISVASDPLPAKEDTKVDL